MFMYIAAILLGKHICYSLKLGCACMLLLIDPIFRVQYYNDYCLLASKVKVCMKSCNFVILPPPWGANIRYLYNFHNFNTITSNWTGFGKLTKNSAAATRKTCPFWTGLRKIEGRYYFFFLDLVILINKEP